ncbi:MAG: 4-aminobutyrate aminotransferase-like enzyme [Phycisphaerales bacterium]
MTQATEATTTVSQQFRSSPAVQAAIEAIVAEGQARSAQITDIRPPQDGLKADYDELMSRAAAVKGRGLLYPYISSGIGNGALVELADGSVKWDMITGIGVHILGHSHPGLIRAQLEAGLEDTTKHGNLQSGFGAYEFGELLLSHAKKSSNLAHAFLTTSGAMANESALKVCYQMHAPASRVIAFEDCFMGRSVTMAQIGDSAGGRQGIPLSTLVDYLPFWNDVLAERAGGQAAFIDQSVKKLEQLINRYPGQYACFIFELVQGEGGFNTAPREFFTALIDVCKANSIAVWDDEIQTFGRTEQMFAYEMYDLGEYVDVFCVGKMTQCCATLYTEQYNPKPGLLSGTFTGNTSDFTVGKLVIDTLAEEGNYGPDGKFARQHAEFRRHAEALIAKHPDWFPEAELCSDLVGGVGGMMKLTPFGGDQATIAKACKVAFEEGLICFWCGHGPYHLRFLPPLPVLKDEDWPRVFEVLERAFARVAS